MEFVGKVVKKDIKGFGVCTGIVQSFDDLSSLFKIVYEDGTSEELNSSQAASLLEEKLDSLPTDHHRPRVGRKPKKRRRVEAARKREGEVGNNLNSLGFVNGNLDINRNVDLGDGVVEELRGNEGVGGKFCCLNVDLNETLEKGSGVVENFPSVNAGQSNGNLNSKEVIDLNAGFNLNLNEGFDFDEAGVANGDCQESLKRECIDLNVDVNGDLDEISEELCSGADVVDSQKRERGFDLNCGIDEDIKDDVDGDCGGQLKEAPQLMEEPSRMVGRPWSEVAVANGKLEEVYVSNGSDIGLAGEIEGDKFVCGKDVGVSNSEEVLNDEEDPVAIGTSQRSGYRKAGRRKRRKKHADNLHSVPQEMVLVDVKVVMEGGSMIINQKQCDTTNASNGVIRRRGRRRKNVDTSNLTQETIADANDVKQDIVMEVNQNECNVGNVFKEGSDGRRKRRKALDNVTSVPEMTVLRRSSRRGSAKNNVSSVTSGMDSSSLDSPEIGALVEEKLVNSCQYPEEAMVMPPKVQLPPSSQKLDLAGLPILDVFSIYACLRSFSTLLFLSPFGLEEFVGALKCSSPTSLFDCIHVSILQILRKHLEYLSNEASESASDCLRSLDWNLLDSVTWPIFMVEYLLIHESGLKTGFDLGRLKLFENDYYKQPVSVKVEILRCLCDGMIEVEAIRSEINRRSFGAEPDLDFDRSVTPLTDKKRKVAMDAVGSSCVTDEVADDTNDRNSDECCLCKMDGNLICCDGCPAAYHSKCVGVANDSLPEGDWYCPECAIGRREPWLKARRSLRGAELIGVDPYGRLYFSSCGYLLVSDSYDIEFSINYYHRDDLIHVIEVLKSSEMYYGRILGAIYREWDISVNSKQQAVCLNGCMTSAAFASSEFSAIKGDNDVACKQEENATAGCSGYLDVGVNKFVNSTCLSSEGSAETTQTSLRNLNFQKKGPGFSDRSNFSNESKVPCKAQSTTENALVFACSDFNTIENREFAAVNGNAPHSRYINYYAFGYTASLVAEDLLRKLSEKTAENSIKSEEEIISAQMKLILKKCDKFHWWNVSSLNADVWKEKCGWCFSCRGTSDDLDCLFNMSLGPVQEGSGSEIGGIQTESNSKGHLIDTVCQVLFIENRLQGLLLGLWLKPHFSGFWRKNIIKQLDIASVKHSLLMLESNLQSRALSADWFKNVDSASTVGSASHIVIASSRASSRKRTRYSESESNSSNAASGLGMLWWRGGKLSRQLFSWKSLPGSLSTKAARQAGGTKISGILYPENSDFAKRNKYMAWRAAVDSSTTAEQLALQVRELDSNIRWDEIENRPHLAVLDKEYRKSIRLFKKVIVRRKCVDGEGSRYLLDFGKRRCIPEVVQKNGSVVRESSSERKKYWLNESYLPLYLLKSFEEKRIARKSSTVGSGKLPEASEVVKKPSKERGFSYLFAKAERSENHQCGHCNKNVPIREAVSCQYCKGFFHKRHVRKSTGSFTANCIYTCHRCHSGKYVKVGKTTEKTNTKRVKGNPKNARIQKQKSKKASVSSKTVQLNNGKRASRGRPVGSKNSKKVAVVPLRRSARKTKYKSPKKKSVGRKGKKVKSKKGTYKKPKKDTPWCKKRTQVYHSYWLNGLLLSRKPDDERVMQFRRKNILGLSESVGHDQPKCALCCETGFTSSSNYISCEMCREWFHGDAFGLDSGKIAMLIGFRCHECRKRTPPVCPHVPTSRSNEPIMSEAQNGTGVESSEKLCNAVSHPNEMNLIQESLPEEDCQGLPPADDAVYRDGKLSVALNSNQVQCGHLLPDLAENMDLIHTSDKTLEPSSLRSSSEIHMLDDDSNKSENDAILALHNDPQDSLTENEVGAKETELVSSLGHDGVKDGLTTSVLKIPIDSSLNSTELHPKSFRV